MWTGVGLRSTPPGLLGGASPQLDAKQFDPAVSLRAGVDPDRALDLIFGHDKLLPDSPLQRKWLLILTLSLHMEF